MRERESGFTLIELLVVILIVAILAAVAIPVFLRQREKGFEDQVRSELKNAAIAIESYATENNGNYGALNADPQLANKLKEQGFTIPSWATSFTVKASGTTYYCIRAVHSRLPAASEWQISTYINTNGEPRPTPDDCP
ncbi:MAG: type IV pilin protein [Actinomycetota bacterium]